MLKGKIKKKIRKQKKKSHYWPVNSNNMNRWLTIKSSVGLGRLSQGAERKQLSISNLYPVELIFKSEGEIMTFPDKQKLREFAGQCISEEMIKEVLYAESSWYWIHIQIHIKKQRALLKVIM